MRIFGKNPLTRKLGTVLNDPHSCLNILSFERNVVPLWWIIESPFFGGKNSIQELFNSELSDGQKIQQIDAWWKEWQESERKE